MVDQWDFYPKYLFNKVGGGCVLWLIILIHLTKVNFLGEKTYNKSDREQETYDIKENLFIYQVFY